MGCVLTTYFADLPAICGLCPLSVGQLLHVPRRTSARGRRHLYLVESIREGKAVRQRTNKASGRKDALVTSGELHRLAASIARHSERSLILSDIDAGRIASRRIGGRLPFGRPWERLEIGEVLTHLLDGRYFGFAVERAVFVATLHRLLVWKIGPCLAGPDDEPRLRRRRRAHLAPFLSCLGLAGEEIEEKAKGALAPRCIKNTIEKKLFDQRRDLFTDLSPFLPIPPPCHPSVSFARRWADTAVPKDFRPDRTQMVLALFVDADGRPICNEMVPGNTAEVTMLVPVVDRLRARFAINHACLDADRGMISADTIAALEERGMDYILGARERSSSVVRDIVPNDDGPMVPLALDRQHGETQLRVYGAAHQDQHRRLSSLTSASPHPASRRRSCRQPAVPTSEPAMDLHVEHQRLAWHTMKKGVD